LRIGKKEIRKSTWDTAGLVFPLHMWGGPAVIKFTDGLKALQPKYLFAVGVNAGGIS